MIAYQTFVGNFPEFNKPATYTPDVYAFWMSMAEKLLASDRWGDLLPYGLQLFVAHNLVLEQQAQDASCVGGAVGAVQGPVTAGSVDKTSYSRDPGLVMDVKHGHWNLTTYGLRYVRLVQMVGAGPVQVGASIGDLGQVAWPGVIFPNAWQ